MSAHTQRIILAGLALAIFLSMTALTIPTLRPWVDEAWAGAPAGSLAFRGDTGTPSFDAEAFGAGLKDIDRVCYWEPPLFLVMQALWYRAAGFTLESLRALSAMSALGGLICWLIVLWRLTGDRNAVVMLALVMCGDYILITAASVGRADSMSFAFQAAGYATFLSLREKRFGLAVLLSQTFVVASGLSHPNGGVLAFCGQLFLTLYFDRAKIRLKHIALGAIPYLVGGTAWGVFILHNPTAFLSQYGYQTGMRFHEIYKPLLAIRSEVERYVQVMGLGPHSPGSRGPHFLKSLIFIGYFAGVAGVVLTPALRRSTAGRVLLGLLAIYLPYYTFLEATKATYYFIYVIFVYAALMVLWLRWMWEKRFVPRALIVAGLAGWIALQSGGLIQRAHLNHYKNGYTAAVEFLRRHAGPNDLIVGSHELGFALGFQPHFLDDCRLGMASGRRPDYIVLEEVYEGHFEAMRQQRPAEYAQLQRVLAQYHEVYNHEFYRILAR